jgi:glycosyltransferase involved in cell wall biosynthesis
MSRILIIAHYFPPMNSTGARRPEALAQYLSKIGDDVVVLTTDKQSSSTGTLSQLPYRVIESSLFFLRERSWVSNNYTDRDSPRPYYRFLKKIKQRYVNRYFGQLADPRITFLISIIFKIAAFRLSGGRFFKSLKYIEFSDYIISTSPPWICHSVGVVLSKMFRIPLILDYRDQFSGNHMFSGTFSAIERKIDSFLCRNAWSILVVSEPMMGYYRSLTDVKVLTIMNGFGAGFDSLPDIVQLGPALGSRILLVRYFGTITADRLMTPLWSALLRRGLSSRFKFEFYGDSGLLKEYFSANAHLKQLNVQFFPAVIHAKVFALMRESDALLFTETSEKQYASQRGVLTTKLFEYLAAGKPIIGIVERDTESGRLIERSGLSVLLSNSSEEIESELYKIAQLGVESKIDSGFIGTFSREAQFSKILSLLA